MFTENEILEYRAGWLMTHDLDDNLTDDEIIDALREECRKDLEIVEKMLEVANDWWNYRDLDDLPEPIDNLCDALVNAHWYIKSKLKRK